VTADDFANLFVRIGAITGAPAPDPLLRALGRLVFAALEIPASKPPDGIDPDVGISGFILPAIDVLAQAARDFVKEEQKQGGQLSMGYIPAGDLQ
jgi:hypothetical protein